MHKGDHFPTVIWTAFGRSRKMTSKYGAKYGILWIILLIFWEIGSITDELIKRSKTPFYLVGYFAHIWKLYSLEIRLLVAAKTHSFECGIGCFFGVRSIQRWIDSKLIRATSAMDLLAKNSAVEVVKRVCEEAPVKHYFWLIFWLSYLSQLSPKITTISHKIRY